MMLEVISKDRIFRSNHKNIMDFLAYFSIENMLNFINFTLKYLHICSSNALFGSYLRYNQNTLRKMMSEVIFLNVKNTFSGHLGSSEYIN